MIMTLEEYLDQEWKIYLGGFSGMSPEEEVELYNEWAPYSISAYESMVQREKDELFLKTADERVSTTETGVNEAQDAIAELGVIAADNAVSMEDVMDALVELGALVASLTE